MIDVARKSEDRISLTTLLVVLQLALKLFLEKAGCDCDCDCDCDDPDDDNILLYTLLRREIQRRCEFRYGTNHRIEFVYLPQDDDDRRQTLANHKEIAPIPLPFTNERFQD